MSRPSSPGDSTPVDQAAQSAESDPVQSAMDARIVELEETKRKLEAELSKAKQVTQRTEATSASTGTKQVPRAKRSAKKSPVTAVAQEFAVTTAAVQQPSTRAAKRQRKDQPSKPQTEQQQTNKIDSEASTDDSRWLDLRQTPAWMISTLVHLVLLLILGLITIVAPAVADFAIIVASEDGDEPLEQLAEVDLSQDLENMEEVSPAFDSPQLNESNISELTLASSVADTSDIGPQVIDQDSVSQINAIFSESGSAMESLSAKVGKMTASFFGSQAKGRRFVFVVDNSLSMGGGRFHTAKNELIKSVEQMEPDQYFYVIFFSDAAYPLFWPAPVSQLVPATPKNKERLQQWLYNVELCLRTHGSDAMQLALSLRPDAIYVLGDGAFTDQTTRELTMPHNRRTPIFTLGMQVKERGAKELNAIAKANGGTYRLVTTAPGSTAAARQAPIKRNRKRGPVWGVKLPLLEKNK